MKDEAFGLVQQQQQQQQQQQPYLKTLRRTR